MFCSSICPKFFSVLPCLSNQTFQFLFILKLMNEPITPVALKFGVIRDTPEGRIIDASAFKNMVQNFSLHQMELSNQRNADAPNEKHQTMQGSCLLTCLDLCGITIQQITQTNSTNMTANIKMPTLTYTSAEEQIARVTSQQKNPSLTVTKKICQILQETKSSTAVFRLPDRQINDKDFQKKYGVTEVPKLSEQSSIKLLEPEPQKQCRTFSEVIAALAPQPQRETAFITIQEQVPDLRSLSGFNAGESKHSQDHKKQVEYFPYVKRIKRKKNFEDYKSKKNSELAQYKARGEAPPEILTQELYKIALIEKKGEQPPDYMLEVDTSSNSDSIISIGGVNREDVEYLVDNNLKEDIIERRIRRDILRSKRTLDRRAIEDVLENMDKFKSSLSQSDDDRGKRGGKIGTTFKNDLHRLKEKFKHTLLQDRKDSKVEIETHQDLKDDFINSKLHQMYQETESNMFLDSTPLASSRRLSPQQSTLTQHAEFLRRKNEIKSRLKAFNINHTTLPGFGQSPTFQNKLKAKLVRLEAPVQKDTPLVTHDLTPRIQQQMDKITHEMQQGQDDVRKLMRDIILASEQSKKRSEAQVPVSKSAVKQQPVKQARARYEKSKYFSDLAFIRRELENQTAKVQDMSSALLVKQCEIATPNSKLKINPSSVKTLGPGEISEPQLTVSIMTAHNTIAQYPIACTLRQSKSFRLQKFNNQSDATLVMNTGSSRESEGIGLNQRRQNNNVVHPHEVGLNFSEMQPNERSLNSSQIKPMKDQEIYPELKAVNVKNLRLENVSCLDQRSRKMPGKMIHKVDSQKMNADLKEIGEKQLLHIVKIGNPLHTVDVFQKSENPTVDDTATFLQQPHQNALRTITSSNPGCYHTSKPLEPLRLTKFNDKNKMNLVAEFLVQPQHVTPGSTHQDYELAINKTTYDQRGASALAAHHNINENHGLGKSDEDRPSGKCLINLTQNALLELQELMVSELPATLIKPIECLVKSEGTIPIPWNKQTTPIAKVEFAVRALQPVFKKKQQSPKKIGNYNNPLLPIIGENYRESNPKAFMTMSDETTQLAYPTPTFSKMGLNASSFELKINSRDHPRPRKTLQKAKVLSPRGLLSQRRPTHQEASSIYFNDEADPSRLSSHRKYSVIRDNSDRTQVSQSKVIPRPVLNKLGGGFLNNNKAFTNTFTSNLCVTMPLTPNTGFVSEMQSDSSLTETNSVIQEVNQIKPNFQIQFRADTIQEQTTGFNQYQATNGISMNQVNYKSMDNWSKGPVIGPLNYTEQKKPQVAPLSPQYGVKYEPSIFANHNKSPKLPVVFVAKYYQKKKKEKPNNEFKDFQFNFLSNETLTRIIGTNKKTKKVQPTTESKLELRVFCHKRRDLP